MSFFGGEVDDESRDEIHWMELHGLKIDYVQKRGRTEYYFTIPKRCNALQEIKTAGGETNYICGVYETRPQNVPRLRRTYGRTLRCRRLFVEIGIRRNVTAGKQSCPVAVADSRARMIER